MQPEPHTAFAGVPPLPPAGHRAEEERAGLGGPQARAFCPARRPCPEKRNAEGAGLQGQGQASPAADGKRSPPGGGSWPGLRPPLSLAWPGRWEPTALLGLSVATRTEAEMDAPQKVTLHLQETATSPPAAQGGPRPPLGKPTG